MDANRPVYLPVAAALERDIHAGILNPGDKLPTHRVLARKVGIAVATVTKAYKEAECRKLGTTPSATALLLVRTWRSFLHWEVLAGPREQI